MFCFVSIDCIYFLLLDIFVHLVYICVCVCERKKLVSSSPYLSFLSISEFVSSLQTDFVPFFFFFFMLFFCVRFSPTIFYNIEHRLRVKIDMCSVHNFCLWQMYCDILWQKCRPFLFFVQQIFQFLIFFLALSII